MIVKNGDLRERIQVKDIIWIQADDYCVRVHTESKTFCLRKSLKFLEEKLKADGFIRILRGALVNMNFLKNIDYRDAKVVLKNELELSLSKSGKYMVKKHIQKVTV